LVAIDHHGRIQLLNEQAAASFGVELRKALGQDVAYLCNDARFNEAIKNALQGQNVAPFDLAWQNRIFLINVSALEGDLHEVADVYGASILLLDVTEKRKMDAAKRDFFANASHELKSPLTSILGYEELLANGTLASQEEVADANERIYKEAKRMQEIIASMLTLSKLEGEAPREKITLDLKAVVEDCLLSEERAIEAKHLHVSTDLSAFSVVMAKDDANNLVRNLIDNAIKYNKESGSLILKLKPGCLEVKDTGVGIKEEDQSRIFERFYRVAGNQGQEGSGLGLSIVKHIALDYGLTIAVNSQYGIGSDFQISFPDSFEAKSSDFAASTKRKE
jgi:two-component system phosphate regulon sensor histidine kinase PhoR